MIIIPTRGRLNFQHTLKRLPPKLHKMTQVVCPSDEVAAHKKNWPLITVTKQPDDNMTIAKKREWIIKKAKSDKILMLDDDLEFFAKRDDDPTRMLPATPEQITWWIKDLFKKLGPKIPHAGFGPKLMNNQMPAGWKSPGRMIYSLGYYLPVVRKECELGRIETREDMDITLQLLRKGYPNAVCYTIACGQTYGRDGGCSGQRTLEGSNADAHKLAELHQGYVKVVQRDYKGNPRQEVICSWLKALSHGQQWRDSSGRSVQKRVPRSSKGSRAPATSR